MKTIAADEEDKDWLGEMNPGIRFKEQDRRYSANKERFTKTHHLRRGYLS